MQVAKSDIQAKSVTQSLSRLTGVRDVIPLIHIMYQNGINHSFGDVHQFFLGCPSILYFDFVQPRERGGLWELFLNFPELSASVTRSFLLLI